MRIEDGQTSDVQGIFMEYLLGILWNIYGSFINLSHGFITLNILWCLYWILYGIFS